MKDRVIKKLNQINAVFYNEVAPHFSSSRQYFWSGWYRLWECLGGCNADIRRVADIGCGNGRFATFLKEKGCRSEYFGIDMNQDLLRQAEKQCGNSTVLFSRADFIERDDFLDDQTFDLIAVFGVIHHIPSMECRRQLVRYLSEKLSPGGFLAISFWKFMEFERFKKKLMDWSLVRVDPLELEAGDHLLSWKRGVNAVRYCHFVDETEENELVAESGLDVVCSFRADGKSGNMNEYVVLEKSFEG